MKFKMAPLVERLQSVLEAERVALLSGNLDDLASLEPKKSQLEAQLSATPIEGAALEPLKQLALHNQALLGAALSGIRRASLRLKPASTGAEFNYYDASGGAISLGARSGANVQKHA